MKIYYKSAGYMPCLCTYVLTIEIICNMNPSGFIAATKSKDFILTNTRQIQLEIMATYPIRK